jgi:hypothetical protein
MCFVVVEKLGPLSQALNVSDLFLALVLLYSHLKLYSTMYDLFCTITFHYYHPLSLLSFTCSDKCSPKKCFPCLKSRNALLFLAYSKMHKGSVGMT